MSELNTNMVSFFAQLDISDRKMDLSIFLEGHEIRIVRSTAVLSFTSVVCGNVRVHIGKNCRFNDQDRYSKRTVPVVDFGNDDLEACGSVRAHTGKKYCFNDQDRYSKGTVDDFGNDDLEAIVHENFNKLNNSFLRRSSDMRHYQLRNKRSVMAASRKSDSF